MKKFLLALFLGLLLIFGMTTPARAEGEDTHKVSISWYYGRASEVYNIYNGEGGTKLGSVDLEVEDGVFDYRSYAESPEGANFYTYYGVSPIIRVNGNYYMLLVIYVEANGEQDQTNFTINLDDSDTNVVIKLGYAKVSFAQPEHLDKIRISINDEYTQNLTEPHTYNAYQILHVTKADSVQEDVTTDETIGKTIGIDDTGFSYYILTSDPWYDVVSTQLTDYLTLEPTTSEDMFIVHLNPEMPATEQTAKDMAAILENYIGDKPSVDLISGEARYDIDPGYWLIISPISSNLIIATTNIDITEKAFYPSIVKTVSEVDENASFGSDVHFISTVNIPQGSKATMILTDTMTDGLTFNSDSLTMNYEFEYSYEPNEHGFVITIPADVIKQLAKDSDITLELAYTANLNKNAVIEPRDDSQDSIVSGNINTIQMNYANYIQESSVDINTTLITVLKYDAEDDTKTPIAGATFQLLNENKEIVPLYEVTIGEVYRLATAADTSSMTYFTTFANKTVTIQGLDADCVYYLRETEAPAGYNRYGEDIEFYPSENLELVLEVPNGTGTELPNTGGSGVTFLYIVGGVMILCGMMILVKKHFLH